MFKEAKPSPWPILEKDIVDEIIFRTDSIRNRIMLELMARGGMRISEVLNLTPRGVEDRKLIMQSLFSRADTGLLKDDSGPTMPSDFASKILTK